MTEEVFVKHCRLQLESIREIQMVYDGLLYSPNWMRVMARDFKLIASNIEDLCNVYEQERDLVKK